MEREMQRQSGETRDAFAVKTVISKDCDIETTLAWWHDGKQLQMFGKRFRVKQIGHIGFLQEMRRS